MQPLEITDAARNITNTKNSNFVTDAELLSYLTMALREASHFARCYETTDVYTSVASQATYTITASAFEIKQITFDGYKVKPVTFREAQSVQWLSVDSAAAGVPGYYYTWGADVILSPRSADANKEIKVYAYSTHPNVTASSTIMIPETLQHYTVDYLAYRILQKEQNPNAGSFYTVWKNDLELMRKEMIQKRRGDAYRQVQTEEALVYGTLGII